MKRVLAVIAAVVLAAVGTFVVLNYARSAEARALAGEETIEVLVATEAIAQGTLAQDIAESQVEVKLIPAKIQTPGSIGNRAELSSELKGMATSVDLVAGEQLLKSRFVDPQVAAAQSEVDVPEGLLEVTVSLEPQRALGGKLTPGETVAVLASFDPIRPPDRPDHGLRRGDRDRGDRQAEPQHHGDHPPQDPGHRCPGGTGVRRSRWRRGGDRRTARRGP